MRLRNISFKRITTTGNFIPEIDGLRFIAVTSVVLYHLAGFILSKDLHSYSDNIDYSIIKRYILHGHLGIPLFFIISGFILGVPFARHFILGDKAVSIKDYFLRRLTRLEPPYILVMTVLLFGSVYVAQTITLKEGFESYLASLIYSHNFLYDVLPLLNGSAWSLEVEVQFYILTPLLTFFFLIRPNHLRRFLIICIIIAFVVFNNMVSLPFRSFINFSQFFLLGFLLADLYVSKIMIFSKTKYDFIIASFLFIVLWLFDHKDFPYLHQKIIWSMIQLTAIFFFYYYVILHKASKFLAKKVITSIGGMCYSIYLLHYPIISLFGNPLLKVSFSKFSFFNVALYYLILLFLILLFSMLFFLAIERPCMDKLWYKKIFSTGSFRQVLARSIRGN